MSSAPYKSKPRVWASDPRRTNRRLVDSALIAIQVFSMTATNNSAYPVIQPVILCGGSGTRLWPMSRSGFPKQFLCLTGAESLFQQAAKRLVNLPDAALTMAPPLIVTHEEQRFLAQEQLRECDISAAHYLLEPIARNTAPALTLAALTALETGADPLLVVTPSDQTIADEAAFQTTLLSAIAAALAGDIVILGVQPTQPETGFGYIQVDNALESAGHAVLSVKSFVEKPDLPTAQRYLEAGEYFWNAGMFILKASSWLKALQTFRPDIARAVDAAWAKRTVDGDFLRPDKALFAQVPAESIDCAVMEPAARRQSEDEKRDAASEKIAAPHVRMAPLAAGWSDLGSWDAVWQALPKDAAGNAHQGDVLACESHNTLAISSGRLVALVGVNDLVVIETADAVLVAGKSNSQQVKNIVQHLGEQQREEHLTHRKVHRPWGWYDCVDIGARFKVKRILVNAGAALSLQQHHHRAEHWVVVKGTAQITCGDKVFILSENQSTYIPLGDIHCLANPGKIPLEIIEIQSGSYLGEDDIVRVADSYGRD